MMPRFVIFAGTTEGRELCLFMAHKGLPALACVTTDYGAELLPKAPELEIKTGRLDKAAMQALIQNEQPLAVIDATHPYAKQVTASLQEVCALFGYPYLRILRQVEPSEDCHYFTQLADLLSWLNIQSGNIFVSTGSKELAAFQAVEDYQKRLFVRVLPTMEALTICHKLLLPGRQIICMQGPFSQELNEAMFRHTGVQILVTKESGESGGFQKKLAAAKACHMQTAVLRRPQEAGGFLLEQAKDIIRTMAAEERDL